MLDIDPITGLPKDLNVWDDITKEKQEISIEVVKRRYGKLTTLVSGFDTSIDVKDISKKLKSKLACGGTAKKGVIELQGSHVEKVKEELVKLGFSEESIMVKQVQKKGRR